MYCENCGTEIENGLNFCTECGTPVAKTPTAGIPTAVTESFNVPTVTTSAPPKKSGKKPLIITLSIFAVLILAGSLAVGLIFLLKPESNGLKAGIESLELVDKGGKDIDLDKVPVSKDIKLVVEYIADFPESGEGVLHLKLEDSRKKKVFSKDVKLKGSEKSDTYEYTFKLPDSMSGLKAKMYSSISVKTKGEKKEDSEDLAFVSEGEPLDIKEAKKKASERVEQARGAIAELAALGINTSGLNELFDKAVSLLNSAKTVEQLVGAKDSASFYADSVINECNARKVAANPTPPATTPQPDANKEKGQQYVTCPSCGGSGSVQQQQTESSSQPCGTCGGQGGTYIEGAWVACPTCGGAGVITTQTTTTVNVTCPTCGGAGRILGMVNGQFLVMVDGRFAFARYCPHDKVYMYSFL